jgi:hypothetical protein
MSRKVDLVNPSPEDLEYMRSRPARFRADLERLESGGSTGGTAPVVQSPAGSPEPDPSVSSEDREWVESLTVEELRDELRKMELPTSGKRAELVDRMLHELASEHNG